MGLRFRRGFIRSTYVGKIRSRFASPLDIFHRRKPRNPAEKCPAEQITIDVRREWPEYERYEECAGRSASTGPQRQLGLELQVASRKSFSVLESRLPLS